MKITVDRSMFHRQLELMRPAQFSREALDVLFDYLEDAGEDIELDVIAICCDFVEYDSLEDFQKDNGEEYQSVKDIEKETLVLRVGEEGFVVQAF